MHGFEHRRIRARGIDVAARGKADTAAHRGREVGDDVAEQVVGDDHVEAARIGDHVDGRGIDVLIGDLDVGILLRNPVHGARPQAAREGQHVGLVHQGQVLATVLRARERIAHHALDAECRVDADLGRHLVRRADAQRTAVAGVRALGAFTHHDEVDGRIADERARHTRIQPAGAQIHVMVEREPQFEQHAALQHTAGHRRVTDRAEQDRVVAAQFLDRLVGQ